MSKKQYVLRLFSFIQSIPKWLLLVLIVLICTGIFIWPLRIINLTQLPTSLANGSLIFWELLQNKDSREAVSTIATIFGGLFVFGNLILVVENLKQTQKNNEINEKRFENERALNESRLASERFSKAIEHIGDKRLTTCLGGIYALRYLSEEEPEKYHQESTRILAALIKALMSEVDRDLILVKSALDTLGNLASQRPCKRGEPDLRAVDFSKMDLSNSCLNQINFYSSIFADTNLHRATFK
ncbi:MAG: pentapeptide repeat-containing protein, partial [Bacteroidota bacterium]